MNRVIKKYPNRRLYDTEESRYITLANIRDLVLAEIPITVIDKKTGADITRSILLQVISEQEQIGDPIMSEAFLEQVIRAYETVAPGFLARHLEQNLTSFLGEKNQVLGHVTQSVGGDAGATIAAPHKEAG